MLNNNETANYDEMIANATLDYEKCLKDIEKLSKKHDKMQNFRDNYERFVCIRYFVIFGLIIWIEFGVDLKGLQAILAIVGMYFNSWLANEAIYGFRDKIFDKSVLITEKRKEASNLKEYIDELNRLKTNSNGLEIEYKEVEEPQITSVVVLTEDIKELKKTV